MEITKEQISEFSAFCEEHDLYNPAIILHPVSSKISLAAYSDKIFTDRVRAHSESFSDALADMQRQIMKTRINGDRIKVLQAELEELRRA